MVLLVDRWDCSNEQKSQLVEVGEVGRILFSITIFRLVSHPVAPHTTRGSCEDFGKRGSIQPLGGIPELQTRNTTLMDIYRIWPCSDLQIQDQDVRHCRDQTWKISKNLTKLWEPSHSGTLQLAKSNPATHQGAIFSAVCLLVKINSDLCARSPKPTLGGSVPF